MSDEHVTDTVARRLARASGRRAVLAALVAGAAAALGTTATGPEAEAHGRARRGCRRDRDCGFGEACRGGRCRGVSGFADRNARCRTTSDCSTEQGAAVCELGPWCGGGGSGIDEPYRRCRGAAGATCRDLLCDCAAGLTCQGGVCAPAPTS